MPDTNDATTTEAKHTAGPWTYEPAQRWDDGKLVPARGFIVRTGQKGWHTDEIRVGSIGGDEDVRAEDEANARLIAAAPDLLAACRELARRAKDTRLVGEDENCDAALTDAVIAAEAALAKAQPTST